MNVQEYLEQDREKFLTELTQKKTPESAAAVISAEWDRLLYRYNAECESAELRECAAGMMEAVKASSAIADSVKEVKVWERALTPDAPERAARNPLTLIASGVVCLALGMVLAFLLRPFALVLSVILPGLLFTAAAVLAFVGGRKLGKSEALPVKIQTEINTECIADGERIFRYMKASAMVMDRRLAELEEELRYTLADNKDGGTEELSDARLALYGDLLEALYSSDGEFALERLKGLNYYLHGLGIEVAEYSEKTEEYFDRMPGVGPCTIRPAMLKDGIILKKGLAIAG